MQPVLDLGPTALRQRTPGELAALVAGLPAEALIPAFEACGGAQGLLGRDVVEVAVQLGIPEAAATRLSAALELGRRWRMQRTALPAALTGGRAVFRYLEPRLAGRRAESFIALYVDAKGRLVREEEISSGTLTASLVHPREVFAPALLLRCAALIVAHNHPSGDPEPSAEDRATTRRLHRAGRLLGIELLDHVVIGDGRYVSFLEEGWMP